MRSQADRLGGKAQKNSDWRKRYAFASAADKVWGLQAAQRYLNAKMGLSVLWSAFCVACFCSEIRRVRWFRSVHLDEALSSHERKISRMVWT